MVDIGNKAGFLLLPVSTHTHHMSTHRVSSLPVCAELPTRQTVGVLVN